MHAWTQTGTCKKTRNVVTGAVLMMAGGAIRYKTKIQKTIAHSSKEAEWAAACEVGKIILFFQSILEDLGVPQHKATEMHEDNIGALYMANTQQTPQ